MRVSPLMATLLDELHDQARHGELDDLAATVYDGLGWHPDYPPTDDEGKKRAALVGALDGLLAWIEREKGATA